jgi:predicted nucleic acid binding AN1-type Zn finger protein
LYKVQPTGQKVTYLCVDCRAKLTPINFAYCKECNLYYCLEHRFHDSHKIKQQTKKT